jgi:hypothetical protein
VAVDAQRKELGTRIDDIKRQGSDFSHLLERELLQLKQRCRWNTCSAKTGFVSAIRSKRKSMQCGGSSREIADLRARI